MLWKEAVNLEDDPEDAKIMLAKATDIIPLSSSYGLLLPRLESAENAQKVLTKPVKPFLHHTRSGLLLRDFKSRWVTRTRSM